MTITNKLLKHGDKIVAYNLVLIWLSYSYMAYNTTAVGLFPPNINFFLFYAHACFNTAVITGVLILCCQIKAGSLVILVLS